MPETDAHTKIRYEKIAETSGPLIQLIEFVTPAGDTATLELMQAHTPFGLPLKIWPGSCLTDLLVPALPSQLHAFAGAEPRLPALRALLELVRAGCLLLTAARVVTNISPLPIFDALQNDFHRLAGIPFK
eukprot:CAMPEP_0171594956 /NCGR_PEP_ID=MMETSP0990-20121206/1028_1 /TAXON_ID=483369 /ORGANISM="non described non described, Strain CCMP2098" /LENGTH=129 /DNA_ID=CAMNT_0012155805 /DNA_START=129 /DNA_END=518 /DNA_ORIENTATION=-